MTLEQRGPPDLILACMAMVDRERRGSMQRSGVAPDEEEGATASMRILSSFELTSVLLLSRERMVSELKEEDK